MEAIKQLGRKLWARLYNNPSITVPLSGLAVPLALEIVQVIEIEAEQWGVFGAVIIATSRMVWGMVSPVNRKAL